MKKKAQEPPPVARVPAPRGRFAARPLAVREVSAGVRPTAVAGAYHVDRAVSEALGVVPPPLF